MLPDSIPHASRHYPITAGCRPTLEPHRKSPATSIPPGAEGSDDRAATFDRLTPTKPRGPKADTSIAPPPTDVLGKTPTRRAERISQHRLDPIGALRASLSLCQLGPTPDQTTGLGEGRAGRRSGRLTFGWRGRELTEAGESRRGRDGTSAPPPALDPPRTG